MIACRAHGLRLEVYGRRTDAAGNAHDAFPLGNRAVVPERSDEVLEFVADVQETQRLGGLADLLKHNRDRASLRVAVADGEWDTLAVLVNAQDNEIAGARLSGDPRRLDLDLLHDR